MAVSALVPPYSPELPVVRVHKIMCEASEQRSMVNHRYGCRVNFVLGAAYKCHLSGAFSFTHCTQLYRSRFLHFSVNSLSDMQLSLSGTGQVCPFCSF